MQRQRRGRQRLSPGELRQRSMVEDQEQEGSMAPVRGGVLLLRLVLSLHIIRRCACPRRSALLRYVTTSQFCIARVCTHNSIVYQPSHKQSHLHHTMCCSAVDAFLCKIWCLKVAMLTPYPRHTVQLEAALSRAGPWTAPQQPRNCHDPLKRPHTRLS